MIAIVDYIVFIFIMDFTFFIITHQHHNKGFYLEFLLAFASEMFFVWSDCANGTDFDSAAA